MARVVTAFAAGEVETAKMLLLRTHLELAVAAAWPGTGTAARVLHGEGLNAIARDRRTRGIPAARGASWRASSIRNFLISQRIAGLACIGESLREGTGGGE